MAQSYAMIVLDEGSLDYSNIETHATFDGAKRAVRREIEQWEEANEITYIPQLESYYDTLEGTTVPGFLFTLGENLDIYIVEVR